MTRETYINYYFNQAGGGLSDIGPIYVRPRFRQRGRGFAGIGNIFGSIFRFVRPMISKLLPTLKKSAIHATSGIINDLGNKPFKQALTDNSKEAVKSFFNPTTHQEGSGRKKHLKLKTKTKKLQSSSRHQKGSITKKKKKKPLKKRILDIFSR